MAAKLKRTIIIARRPKGRDDVPPEVRLFWMNDKQAAVYNTATTGLMRRGVTRPEAEGSVESVLQLMFEGHMPREQDPGIFHEMRILFPIINDTGYEKLPIAGAPNGWIEQAILYLQDKKGPRAVRFEFNPRQRNAYNEAIAAVHELNELSRDDAWMFVNNTVGALISGMASHEQEHPVLQELADAFPTISHKVVKRLPHATEEDVKRWSFRPCNDESAASL